MTEQNYSEDLPLMSNVEDMLVNHYNFFFKCELKEKHFICTALLFLEAVFNAEELVCKCLASNDRNTSEIDPLIENNTDSSLVQNNLLNIKKPGFTLILDCHQILIEKVEALDLNDYVPNKLKFCSFKPSLVERRESLQFAVCDWSLKIWKSRGSCKHCFPKYISVTYKTVPSCPSLMWVSDQNGKPSVFNHGAFINNRALFPCQEPPVAMATWEATVTVCDPVVVLMSGDKEPVISQQEGHTDYYYYTQKVLPLSTLCIAIGSWEHHVIPYEKNLPKCRLFASPNLLERCKQEFEEYIPRSLKASRDILGEYPFPRIDFLVVPSTFGSLGMASPNVVYLSQSLLSGDKSFCSRISHEIAHGWFGLSIGALDWSEEWLSEGFATFLEDVFHAKADGTENVKDLLEIKEYIRKKTLIQEIENTSEGLQILRSSQGKKTTMVVDELNATVLKNGQNKIKNFTQVHYIKGYFLLKHLSGKVGLEQFLEFLKLYVKKFEGQLVTSSEFLGFFLDSFPYIRNCCTVEDITEKWLHNSGINMEIESIEPSADNKLFKMVELETKKWKSFNKLLLKKRSKKRKCSIDDFTVLNADQTVLLLENLLQEERASFRTLESLDKLFQFSETNAEVQHRWFELVVKHNYRCKFKELEYFLLNHLAMGVYLYGELIYSGDKDQHSLAKKCFDKKKLEMESNFRKTIQEMFDINS